MREHNEAVNRLDFIEGREEITADYAAGTVIEVPQHDGTIVRLRKLAEDYDPTDRIRVMNYMQERAAAGEVVTGLLYVEPEPEDLHSNFNTVEAPLNSLAEAELCPGSATLAKINTSLR